MKALIVDDEILARKRIAHLLTKVPEIKEVQESSSGTAAIQQIQDFKPDLLFLDINLQDMTGFDILQNIHSDYRPSVIFVTAYDIYALQAFDFDAFDFLLKPFKEDRFFRAIKKVIKKPGNESNGEFQKRMEKLLELHEAVSQKENLPQKLPIKLGNKTMLIDSNKIRYVCASGYYAEIYTDDNKYLIRESLTNLENILNSNTFFRIHRSTIVNLNAIQEIVHSDFAEIDIRMTDKKLFSVSKSQKKEFLKKLGLK